jgi:hypothetical protein
MKNQYYLFILATSALLSSCSYNGASNPPVTTTDSTLVNFKQGFHSQFDVFVVDTADASGNNGDKILNSTRKSVQEITVSTGITYKGKSNVAMVVTFDQTNDTNYFYQDPNGDLYRYNFGFNILNQYSFLVQALGKPIDEGWVLASKMKSSAGTPWVAKSEDSIQLAGLGLNLYVHFSSSAQMLADTTIIVGTTSLVCRHARHHVIAFVPQGQFGHETGDAYVDTYISTSIGAVPLDFYHHVVLSGTLLTAQAQGKFKLMTSYY